MQVSDGLIWSSPLQCSSTVTVYIAFSIRQSCPGCDLLVQLCVWFVLQSEPVHMIDSTFESAIYNFGLSNLIPTYRKHHGGVRRMTYAGVSFSTTQSKISIHTKSSTFMDLHSFRNTTFLNQYLLFHICCPVSIVSLYSTSSHINIHNMVLSNTFIIPHLFSQWTLQSPRVLAQHDIWIAHQFADILYTHIQPHFNLPYKYLHLS